MLPRLPAATLSSPGRLLSRRNQLGQRAHPNRGGAVIMIGCSPMKPIGTKSRSTSDRKVLLQLGRRDEIRGERHA